MRAANSLPRFMLALRQSLVDSEVLPPSCINWITEKRWLQYIPGQYGLALMRNRFVPEDQGGAGLPETIFSGTISFRFLCQTAVDTATTDVIALTGAGMPMGVDVLFEKVLPIIRFWDGCDPNDNSYLIEPLHISPAGLSEPRRHPTNEEYTWSQLDAQVRICIGTGGSGV